MEETVKDISSSYEMKGSIKDNDSFQLINYHDADVDTVNENTAVLITGDEVKIVPSSGKHSMGSSKVKLKNVVDYSWEYKFYDGQILAIHISGTFIAYGLQGKESGIIRVIDLKNSHRALIKGIEGMTQDISFAFIMHPILLACIDSIGDVYVYKIEQNEVLQSINCQLTLHITQKSTDKLSKVNRIVWCPYVPDDDDILEDDPWKLLVTRGNKAHVWNVNTVQAVHGLNPVTPDSVTEGFVEIKIEFSIVDVAFSPDGSTVALACSDGGIRFFQVDVQEDGESLQCIHDWRPHDNKPVSCLYFLDNHLRGDSHFWKFAVTGVEGNTELKVWTCESWQCLQTIKYEPVDCSPGSSIKLKVAVDITANFLLISDMERKLLHILHLKKDVGETEMRVHIISEFLLSSPVISFGIVKAAEDYFTDEGLKAFENSVGTHPIAVVDADEKTSLKTIIKLYTVQPKALHECIVTYDSDETSDKFNGTKLMTKNLYGDVVENKLRNGLNQQPDEPYNTNIDSTMTRRLQELLESKDLTRRSVERENIILHVSPTLNGDQDQEDVEEECSVLSRDANGVAIISTGSSPSREVQNILFASQVGVTDDNVPEIPTKTENELPPADWPRVPIPEPETLCPTMSKIKLRSPAEPVCIIDQSEMKKHDEDHVVNAKTTTTTTTISSMFSMMESLETRFNQLNDTIKRDMSDVKHSLNIFNQYLMANNDGDKKKVHQARNLEDRYAQDRLATAISQNVNSMIGSEVEYLIKQEISASVLPSLKNSMDTFGQQLQVKLQQHLSLADQQLKEYIIKTVHKKSVTDALAQSLATIMPSVVTTSFAEVFCNVILPKFEKSCHEMFDQVNNLFVDGTKDFVNVLQSHVRSYEEKQCSILQHKMEEFMRGLNEVTENVSLNTMKGLEPQLMNAVQKSLDEQKRYLETCLLHASKAPTPSILHAGIKPHQEHIELLLAQGKVEEAIEQVLSASDLKLLIHLCEKLDPEKLFVEPCKLQQHILLSFIQQLSADFNIHTDLKHKFLEGALMSLDRKHVICEKNIPRILPTVRTRIAQYVNSNPNSKNTRHMRMLLMVVDSLLSDKNEI